MEMQLSDPKLEKEASAILNFADGISEINSDAEYEEIGEAAKQIKAVMNKFGEFFDPLIANANKTHKALTKAKRDMVDPLDKQFRKISGILASYIRKKQEEQRQKEVEAIKAAEKKGDNAPIVIPPSNTVKVEDISTRDNWSAQITDLRALVKDVAAGKVPIEAIMANQSFLNSQARALKESLKYSGVVAVNNPTSIIKS